jgi:hypothetical protein
VIHHLFKTLPIVLIAGSPAFSQTCEADLPAVQARIAELEPTYGAVLSDIDCDAPTIPAHQLLCSHAEQPGDGWWDMLRLDTLAWVYAYENATGNQVDLANPPLDEGFIATRDSCADMECLCAVLQDHTNSSLGGTSPYAQ